MELPVELIGLITAAIGAGVTWLVVAGVKGLGEAFDKDFSNAAKVLAAVISAGVVSIAFGIIDLGLSAVPVDFQPIAQSALSLLVLLFSAFGIQRQKK